MSWSYSSNPASSSRDAVRFLVQDTDETVCYVQDEEIDWMLTQKPNTYSAAVAIAQVIAAKLASNVDKQVGDLRLSASQKHEQYRAVVASLQYMAATQASGFSGGISVASKDTYEADSDRVKPAFGKDLFRNPELVGADDK